MMVSASNTGCSKTMQFDRPSCARYRPGLRQSAGSDGSDLPPELQHDLETEHLRLRVLRRRCALSRSGLDPLALLYAGARASRSTDPVLTQASRVRGRD